MAVVVGGLLVGLVGRLVWPARRPWLLFAAPVLFGALGHLVAMLTVGGPLSEAFVAREIPPLGLPIPLDYAAGSLMGVAMGLGWARSFIYEEGHEERPPPAPA